MPTPEQIAAGASLVKTALEAAVPVLAPFDPVITLVFTAIRAHFNATKTWPTQAEVMAALPADYRDLIADWQAWRPSGDGTLDPAPPLAPPSGS